MQLAGITGKVKNRCGQAPDYCSCADNGVIEEGVSCSPQSVTPGPDNKSHPWDNGLCRPGKAFWK